MDRFRLGMDRFQLGAGLLANMLIPGKRSQGLPITSGRFAHR
jgi:hypothetical protein